MPNLARLEEPRQASGVSGGFVAGLGEWSCRITSDSPAGEQRLTRLFSRYATQRQPSAGSGVTVCFEREGGPWIRVTRAGRAVDLEEITMGPEWSRLLPLADPARRLFSDEHLGGAPVLEAAAGEFRVLQHGHWPMYAVLAFLWLMLQERSIVGLHAAVSAVDGEALVLVGASGSGKSTLSWALHEQGADYFGDELAFFTLPEHHLSVLPRDLCLRPGGLGLLDTAPEPASWWETRPGDPKCGMSLPAPPAPCPRDRASFLFMNGFAERPQLRPLGGGDAVRRLLRGICYRDPSLIARLEVAAGLSDRYPCWSLDVGAPRETAAFLIDHVRRKP